jgi:hypothetical protein
MINVTKTLLVISIVLQVFLFYRGIYWLTEGEIMLGLFLVLVNLFGLYLNMMNVKSYSSDEIKNEKFKD